MPSWTFSPLPRRAAGRDPTATAIDNPPAREWTAASAGERGRRRPS